MQIKNKGSVFSLVITALQFNVAQPVFLGSDKCGLQIPDRQGNY